MAFNREQYMQHITDIGTCEDETQRRTMLATLTQEAGSLFDTNEQLTASVNDLTDKNQKLKDANMELFLQVGNNKKPDAPGGNHEEPPKRRRYEDLFDEKGELK